MPDSIGCVKRSRVCKDAPAGNNAVTPAGGPKVMKNGVRQDEHPGTVGALIDWCAGELDAGGVYCGHGTASTIDESASLVYHVAGLEHDALNHNVRAAHYALPIDAKQFEQVHELLRRRIDRRIPTPYLLNEAWFAGLKFYVDERVLIPRSPFAELIVARFEPWLGHTPVRRILEIGTGSACIAIACATAFPDSTVVATDVSDAALEVAAINVARHGFNDRITLLQADVFDGVSGYFDLIVSNPPYVPEAEMESLPAEYLHEPSIALASGPDGLASARRILQDAAGHLESGGMLAVEVGAGWRDLEAALPRLPFVWPALERGGEGIALIRATDLAGAQSGKVS